MLVKATKTTTKRAMLRITNLASLLCSPTGHSYSPGENYWGGESQSFSYLRKHTLSHSQWNM